MDRYLGFAMLAYRGGIRKNVIVKCQKLFRAKEKVILPLDDADFAELLDRKKKAAASAAQAHGIDDFLIARLGEVMVPIKVFVGYSRKDKAMMEELETALQPLADRGAIDLWIDRAKVPTGKPWEEEIRKAVAAAEVAILLVSPDSVASRVIIVWRLPPVSMRSPPAESRSCRCCCGTCPYPPSSTRSTSSTPSSRSNLCHPTSATRSGSRSSRTSRPCSAERRASVRQAFRRTTPRRPPGRLAWDVKRRSSERSCKRCERSATCPHRP